MVTKNEIKTKNQTKQDKKPELTKTNIKQLKMISKKMNIENYEELTKNTNRKIHDSINKYYENVGTREQIAYSVKKLLMVEHWEGTRQQTAKHRDVKYWSEKSSGLTSELQTIEDKQEKTHNEKENWKTQAEIITIRDNIKQEIETEKNELKKYTIENRYLLLCMLTMQPPLRTNFYESCKIIKSSKDINETDNLLLLSKKGIKLTAMYIINNDKVTERQQKFKLKENKEIIIENEELIKILHDDYENRPRLYLFETHDKKPYKNINETLLHKPLKINFDICRSSYITNFYKIHPYKKERSELARQMRHDMDTAYTKYNKRTTETDFKDDAMIKSIFSKISKEEKEYLLSLL